MSKSQLMRIIREEVEVVLTNAEAVEFFDLDPAALIDEAMGRLSKMSKRDRERDTMEEPPEVEKPKKPKKPKEYDVADFLADNDPEAESKLPASVQNKLKAMRRKFHVGEPAS